MRQILVNVSNITIGKGHPIVVQSMCNTDTNDIEASITQCIRLHNAGSQMIRLTTQGLKEVESLRIIKQRLHSMGIFTPLVADVHFSSAVAIAAAEVADKVRINPGNFAKDHSVACADFKRFIEVCKKHGTAVRIGINHGSLGNRITELYGNTPKAMKEAMAEWVGMCRDMDFDQIVLSLKASSVPIMTEAYLLLDQWMRKQGIVYPLHLGVTEAGNGDMGRIKSASGISELLSKGIGETIRVSLTEDPVNEIPVAKYIADYFDGSIERSCKQSKDADGTPHFSFVSRNHDEFIIEASCVIGPLLIGRVIDDFSISCICSGKEMDCPVLEQFKNDIMQATKRRVTQCEYIACPSCGRTLYDIEKTFNEVKARTSHLRGLTIAVMGCIVNGPGEMADADYGYVGEGRGKVTLYRGKTPVMRSVPQENAIDALLELIDLPSLRGL